MSILECEWEERIARATGDGHWDDDLRAHVDRCPVCADVALVARTMHAESIANRVRTELPDPQRLWWRARVHARRETVARATRPIAAWELVASTTGLLAAVAAVWLFWPSPDVQQAWMVIETTTLGVILKNVALAAVTLLAFLIGFGFYIVRTEA